MADQLPTYAFHPGNARYDWDAWLNGKPWRLRRGQDFTCSPSSVRSSAHKAAKERGCRVLSRREDADTIVIQAVQR